MSDSRFEGWVKRIESNLRARFPHLVTSIYEVTPNEYMIVLLDQEEVADEITQEFDSIRYVTVAVQLSNEIPESYIAQIEPLTEQESIGTMVGLPVTLPDLRNLVQSRFPKVDVVGVTERHSPESVVSILVREDPGSETRTRIEKFLESLRIPVATEIQVTDKQAKRFTQETPLYIRASTFRSKVPSYVNEDERFWFDNIERIGSNQFDLKRFPGVVDGAFRCYHDFTVGELDHLNIRHALLLYDEVWCSLPLIERQQEFLASQHLTKDDLLAIVDAGRLKLVTTQPEERLDIRLLEAIHERVPDAIMGRRTTAALLISDVVRSYERSFLREADLLPVFGVISEFFAERLKLDQNRLLRLMLWPLASVRGGLLRVLDMGSKGGPCVSLVDALVELIKEAGGPDIYLEAMFAAEPVHIGHALDATVFGPTSEPEANRNLKALIGNLLNLHRHFNMELAPAWLDNEKQRIAGVTSVPSLPLFSFKSSVPIEEFLGDIRKSSTRTSGRALYARLAHLPKDQRADEIDKLCAELRKQGRSPIGLSISLDVADTFASLIPLFFDTVVPGIGGFSRLAQRGVDEARLRSANADKAIERVTRALDRDGSRSELHFLSQIQRVAGFREEWI